MTPEQEKARNDFNTASLQVKACKPGDNASESRYGVTYRRMATLGLVTPLRKKYR